MSFGRGFALVAAILGLITIVFVIICVVIVVRTQNFLGESSTATGRVIEMVPRESCDADDSCSTVYAPRVQFTTADGRRVVFTSGSATSPPAYEEGERVDVRYRPDQPEDARIDSIGGVWTGALVTGGLGLFFAALCAVWVLLAVRFRHA